MKYLIYAITTLFFLASCSKDNDGTGGGSGGGGETGGVTDVTPVTSDLTVRLATASKPQQVLPGRGLPQLRTSPAIWPMYTARKMTVRK